MLIRSEQTLIEPPESEPLDVDETKLVLRFGSTSEDDLIQDWIQAAREAFEQGTARQLITAVWELWLDGFPDGAIELPRPPLQSVTSITYLDSSGAEVVLDEAMYTVNVPLGPMAVRGWIDPAPNQVWPTAGLHPFSVKVRFVAGYGDAAIDVPRHIKAMLYLLVGAYFGQRSEMYDNKTAGSLQRIPFGVDIGMRLYRESARPNKLPTRA